MYDYGIKEASNASKKALVRIARVLKRLPAFNPILPLANTLFRWHCKKAGKIYNVQIGIFPPCHFLNPILHFFHTGIVNKFYEIIADRISVEAN